MKKTIGIALGLGLACASNASIVVHGSTTAYQENNKDWVSATANDIDAVAGYGTDGFLMFGDGSANLTKTAGQAWGTDVRSTPSYVTAFAAGANFASIAEDQPAYASYDDPVALDGTDTLGGFAVATSGNGIGSYSELMTFTISGLAADTTVRVGVLGNIDGQTDGRWIPTSITLSDGTSSATVGDHTTSPLANAVASTDWVFFDIDADGTYALGGTQRLAGQGIGVAGVTFDSIPEPATLGLVAAFGGGVLFIRRRFRM
ncbi:hypothetical protein PDESU_01769 [Pontiella desulfatans]|uniref:PEP-CTERM protein-sorting domain-containing protein n=1 Tax=Pontiella desulfatans TaxID=2750659 RepID=A0A6C2U021_PONDE|nr:PEP-CTERM sorting domain-containing protein [Pontiella desulfatans]VGO13215.1 hypothetical protein PDESU_01769 [Pontiella desulfatans]